MCFSVQIRLVFQHVFYSQFSLLISFYMQANVPVHAACWPLREAWSYAQCCRQLHFFDHSPIYDFSSLRTAKFDQYISCVTFPPIRTANRPASTMRLLLFFWILAMSRKQNNLPTISPVSAIPISPIFCDQLPMGRNLNSSSIYESYPDYEQIIIYRKQNF